MERMAFQAKKWVECDDPVQQAGAVVRDALADRLAAVEHYLEPESSDGEFDPEDVHQLRVATRRADAALVAFAEFLPRRKAKKLRKALKRMRKAAGEVRDNDVMAMRYSTAREEAAEVSHDWLWARVVDARRAARPGLDEIYEKAARKEFSKRAEKVLDRVRWRGEGAEPTFSALAAKQLANAADKFFDVARERPTQADALHELRIAGKRFRYAIELFAAMAPALREDIYPVVEEVQEWLGKANDHAVAAKRIADWQVAHSGNGGGVPHGVGHLVKREKKKATKARADFHGWWTSGRAEDAERRFREAMHSAVKTAENKESP
jgi:CHAD domain-containing protein